MQILVSVGAVGASPQIGQIWPPCDFFWLSRRVLSLPFFSRSCTQVEPLDRFSRFMAQTTCFRPRMVLLGVRMMGDHIRGNMPPKPPKMGVNWQFQAKTAKYKNLQNYKSDQDQIWGPSWYRQLHFVGDLTLPISNPIWLTAAILKKCIWRHNSADDHRITTKYGRQMQNGMLMTIHRSKSKPEIEFQYGGPLFSETGSSYISAVDWDISSKFGMQIDFHLLKQNTITKPEPGSTFPTLWPPSWKINMTS